MQTKYMLRYYYFPLGSSANPEPYLISMLDHKSKLTQIDVGILLDPATQTYYCAVYSPTGLKKFETCSESLARQWVYEERMFNSKFVR